MHAKQRATALAVASLWLLNGLVTGSLSAKLPELASGLHLSDGELGLALLGQTIGLVVVIFTIGDRLIFRFGARRVGLVSAALYSASFALPAQAGGIAALFSVFLLIGVFNAPLDIAMQESAGALEARWKVTLMSRFEFCFNAGLVAAAGFAFATAGRFDVAGHLRVVAGIGLVLTVLAIPFLPDTAGAEEETDTVRPPFTAAIWGMAALAVIALWCEATVLDWMGIFYAQTLDAGPAQYAVGLMAFVTGLMTSLWFVRRLSDRLGPVRIVTFGAAAFAVGLAVTLLAPSLAVADAGLAIAGLGLANIHPLALSAARAAGGPTALARVGGISYVGLALAKPFIGGVSELTSLRIALGFSSVLAACMVVVGIAVAQTLGAADIAPEQEAEQPVKEPAGISTDYANRPGVRVVTADLGGSLFEQAGVIGALVAELARSGTPVERLLVRIAERTNPQPKGHLGIDAELLERIRTAAAAVDGIDSVGDPLVDLVGDRSLRAVIGVMDDATDAAFEACASAVAQAVPELTHVLVCREIRT